MMSSQMFQRVLRLQCPYSFWKFVTCSSLLGSVSYLKIFVEKEMAFGILVPDILWHLWFSLCNNFFLLVLLEVTWRTAGVTLRHSSFSGCNKNISRLFPCVRGSFASMANWTFVLWDSTWKFEMISVLSSCFFLTKPGRMFSLIFTRTSKTESFLTSDEYRWKNFKNLKRVGLFSNHSTSLAVSLSIPPPYPKWQVSSYFLYTSNANKKYLIYPFWQTYYFWWGLRCGRLEIRCVE